MKKAGKKYMYGGDKKKVRKIQRSNPELYHEMIHKAKAGGSKVKKMKPYTYGGTNVPGMFEEDDRMKKKMMYGGTSKKKRY